MLKHKTLLFLFLAIATLTAQDETITLIQRNHYPAGQFQAAVAAGEQLGALYRENGATTPMTAYIFDDNTIEFVWELPSAAGIDRIEDEYAAAKVRIGADRIKDLVVPATRQEFLLGGEEDELSYIPEGTDLSEMNFIQVIRARIRTDDMDEFYRVAAEEAELAKQQDRQTPFYLEMYPMGLGTREFEVVEFGKDRADFEHREAQSEKTHYRTNEYKAWEKRRDKVAKVISVRTGVRNEKISIPNTKDRPNEGGLLLVTEMSVADGKQDAVMEYFQTYNELSTQYHYPQASHFATTSDGRTVMHFVPLDDYADMERLRAKSRQMSYAPKEALARVRRDDKELFSHEQEYMLRHHPDESYEPENLELPSDQPLAWSLTVYEYSYGRGEEAWKLIKEIKAGYEAANSAIAYDVYSPSLAGNTGQVYVVTYGTDRDDLRRRNAEGNAALPAAKRTELQNRQEELMKIVRRVSGTTHLDKRYTPATEEASR